MQNKFVWWVVCDKDNVPKLIYPDKDWAKDRAIILEGSYVSVDGDGEIIWWAVARKDNEYPLTVYPDKERAESMAKLNSSLLVPLALTIGQYNEI